MVTAHKHISEEKAWDILNTIPDPDIPVISIVELGIVRQVVVSPDDLITVTITPSYSGCPAMHVFKEEIVNHLIRHGAKNVVINISHAPAWTTDWLSDGTKEKLKNYGIAPPEHSHDDDELFTKKKISCPFCNGINTKLTSQFGSTPCKALWFCNNCQQPFEYFKCY